MSTNRPAARKPRRPAQQRIYGALGWALCILVAGAGRLAGQTGEDGLDYQSLLTQEMDHRQEIDSHLPAEQRRELAAAEFNGAIDRAEDLFMLGNGGLLPSFAEMMRRDRWLDSFNSIGLPTGATSKNASCGVQYGVDFQVPFGSYNGDEVAMLHENSSSGPPFPFILERQLRAMGGAWSFEPGGILLRVVEMVDARVTVVGGTPTQYTDCSTVIRYRYLGPRGDVTFTARDLDPVCNFRIDDVTSAGWCGPGGPVFGGASYPPQCARPAQYWSTHGQVALDLSNPQAPVLRFPDGSTETFGLQANDWSFIFAPAQAQPFYAHHQSLYRPELPWAMTVEAYWTTAESRDRNGNRTVFEYDPATRQVSGVVDPMGNHTSYARDGQGNVISIARPGNGGTPLTWSLTWQTLDWPTPGTSFPEIDCWESNNSIACPAQSSTTLSRLTLPDGRAYQFTYEPWGALNGVQLPDGGAATYAYGDGTTFSFVPAAWMFIDNLGNPHFQDNCPRNTEALLKRRLISSTSYPLGLAGPGFVTTKRHRAEDQLQSAPLSGRCWKLQWIEQIYPDGKIRKTALCEEGDSRLAALDGRVFADEVWDGSGLREATYYGNTGTIGDSATAIGTMYVAFEKNDVGLRGGHSLDTRPTKVVHLRDGVRWSETMAYDSSDIPASGGVFRTLGNVVTSAVFDANGNRVRRTATGYLTDPAYRAANLIHLPVAVKLEDGAGVRVARTDTAYDQFPLQASLAPNLVDPGLARGNATTVTRYADAVAMTGAVSTTTRYYDTGLTYQATDPRGARTTNTRPAGDFAACSATHAALTSTTTNELGHAVTTVSDCVTGQALSVTDADGQATTTSYDRLGRVTQIAGPGDSASAPTQWFEYYLLGSTGNTGNTPVASLAGQRTVAHSKDGSADGLYAKTFTDGLGRAVQVRSEVDPATSGGFAEKVVTQEYDGMSRIFRSLAPCFAAASVVKADCPSPKVTAYGFDVLGRTISVAPPGLPATTTSYGGDGLNWIATLTGPNGANSRTRTTTDLLGRTVQVERYWAECPGGACWLATRMDYDGADRLLKTTDPAGNQSLNTWDHLGRLLTSKDPDRGGFANKVWSYSYDANGNLLAQTDAKGQGIGYQYDLLNRLTRKDLPPAGAGEEDVTFYYDGLQPSTCYSCDDHCAATTDACNAATLTCAHTGTPCDGSVPPCTFTLTPPSVTHGSAGITATVAVGTTAGCAWTASGGTTWLSITGGAAGTGLGTVTYKLTTNSTGATRVGTLTIAGLAFQVTQTAAATCSYSLSPTSASAPAGGGPGSFSVNTTSGCSWSAVSNAAWISITAGTPGSGPGVLSYSVTANSSGVRSGTITAAGQTFTVNQAAGGSTCTYSISPASNQHPAGGGGGNVNVTTTTGCSWAATSNVSWLHVTSGGSGSGSGTVNYSVDANPNPSPRSGTLSIADQTFTANQAALVPGNRSLYLVAALGRYVSVPSSPTLDVTAPFTVEAWVETLNSALAQQGIVERYNSLATDDGGFALRLASGRPQFWVIRNAASSAMVASPSVLTGGWHHVAGELTGSELRIYVDGRLDGTLASTLAPAAGTRSLKIGARGDDASFPFDGFLDEVRLSSGALYDANFAPAPHLAASAGQTRGLWRFDDTTASDTSGNGNHGSLVNGAAVGGVDDYPEYGSLALDGVAAYVQVPDSPSLDVSGKITLEAWIKTTATAANQRIVVRGNYSLKLISSGGANKLKMSLTGSTSTNALTSSGTVATGVWHHVAGVYASGEMRLYIDGVLDTTGTASEGVASSTGALRIGAASDGTEPFQGWIDEVRVTSKNLYSTPTIPREPRLSAGNGTRGLWRFDRHYVSDVSGNGNNGAFFFGAGISNDVPTP